MNKPAKHITELVAFSLAVRLSTVERLKQVPAGKENWKISPGALSFGDTTSHLIDTDEWLIKKITEKNLLPILGVAGSINIMDNSEYLALINKLEVSGKKRAGFIRSMDENEMNELIYDERFGKDVSAWWIIVRGNLDHEIHHRGAISAALRIIADQKNK